MVIKHVPPVSSPELVVINSCLLADVDSRRRPGGDTSTGARRRGGGGGPNTQRKNRKWASQSL